MSGNVGGSKATPTYTAYVAAARGETASAQATPCRAIASPAAEICSGARVRRWMRRLLRMSSFDAICIRS